MKDLRREKGRGRDKERGEERDEGGGGREKERRKERKEGGRKGGREGGRRESCLKLIEKYPPFTFLPDIL